MSRRRRKLSRRRALIDCRIGHHRFGPGNEAGGGIVRRTCRHCGALSIDLTAVETSKTPTWFAMPHSLLAEGPDDSWQYSERQYSERQYSERQYSERQFSDGLFPIETNQPGPG